VHLRVNVHFKWPGKEKFSPFSLPHLVIFFSRNEKKNGLIFSSHFRIYKKKQAFSAPPQIQLIQIGWGTDKRG